MRSDSIHSEAGGRWALTGLLVGLLVAPVGVARAQTRPDRGFSSWRVGASVGAYGPRSALIKASQGASTRLGAGPSFSLDLQYVATRSVALYLAGTTAFSRVALGASIQPAVSGPSTDVTLVAGTGGLVVTIPAVGWLGEHLQPTVRVGGGFKGYAFDLTGAANQWRPTVDLGLGFRGAGGGPIEVTAEVRYLVSSFDQAKLPTRGIAPQNQRQNDLILQVGIGIRP
jgi:hypothetical protein